MAINSCGTPEFMAPEVSFHLFNSEVIILDFKEYEYGMWIPESWQIFCEFRFWILSVVLKILMWRGDFFQFPCYSQEEKIPQKFIVREGGKGKRTKVLCNFVPGHNRYLVSAQQEIASRGDFFARAAMLTIVEGRLCKITRK